MGRFEKISPKVGAPWWMFWNYTPLQKKRKTWFRSPQDPSLHHKSHQGISKFFWIDIELLRKFLSRRLEIEETTHANNILTPWDRWPRIGVVGAPEPSVAFLLEGSVFSTISYYRSNGDWFHGNFFRSKIIKKILKNTCFVLGNKGKKTMLR